MSIETIAEEIKRSGYFNEGTKEITYSDIAEMIIDVCTCDGVDSIDEFICVLFMALKKTLDHKKKGEMLSLIKRCMFDGPIKELNDTTDSEEGELLLMAIAHITTNSKTGKSPGEVLGELQETRKQVFKKGKVNDES
jgi:hypothetical protein